MTPRELLDLPIGSNDAGAATVREYLIELLLALWDEGEGFSGKRPFGNSSWEYDLYKPMIEAGIVAGSFDEDGYLDEFLAADRKQADDLIRAAIKSLGTAP